MISMTPLTQPRRVVCSVVNPKLSACQHSLPHSPRHAVHDPLMTIDDMFVNELLKLLRHA